MKKLTPKAFFSLVVILCMSSWTATAQNQEKKAIIKEWLIANKGNVTLLSTKEYQQMSPSVKAIMDANKQTLIYDQEVTQKDLEAFEAKNVEGSYVSFKTICENATAKKLEIVNAEKKQEERKYKLTKWLDSNRDRNIKIISRQDYESRPEAERTYIDNLEDKIIYEGTALTLEDVKAFEKKKR
ncbi:hypothetical protein [Aureispira sp. CCB-E]|uniref:hypothetical protein n=1 Tax=Aureispira sp. CCB-E TaxID=3051121 RepID=UPI002868A65C|nr:hypothetical protein [Aureispira sp. CCB-E]WMX12591.1 hypothetical protein QP953_17310 [Aureispira sp. CCB-E]